MLASQARYCAFAFLVAGGIGLIGCQGGKNAPSPPPPPVVGVVKPIVVPVQSFYEYNGHLDTTQMVKVMARARGLITKIHFKDGAEVRGQRGSGFLTLPGDPLYTIDEREYRTAVKKAEAELEKSISDVDNWKAQIDLAKAELRRAEKASNDSAISLTEVDKARATVKVNTAMLASAEANRDASAAALHTAHIQLGYTKINARIDGQVSRTMVDEGNLVGQNPSEPTMLTTIVNMEELFVYFDVPERDWAAWGSRLSTDHDQSIEVGASTEEGFPHKGRIDFRDNRVDTGTGTVRIRARVPNPKQANGSRLLYPGLYARVRVPRGKAEDRPVIPEEALMTGQEGRYVYVVDADNKVKRKTVELGPQIYRAPPAIEEKASAWDLFNPKPPAPPTGGLPPPKNPRPVNSVVAIERGLTKDDVIIVDGLQKTRPGGEVVVEMWEFRGPKK